MSDKKTEVKKTITKKKDGNVTSSLETTITVTSSGSWRNLMFCRLHSRIVNAYLEAIELAKENFVEEETETPVKTKEAEKGVEPPKTENAETTKTTKYRDNLKHYENLYRCYIEKKRVDLNKIVIICTTIIICVTIACCLLSPRFNSLSYQSTQTSTVTTRIDDASYSVENSLSVGNT